MQQAAISNQIELSIGSTFRQAVKKAAKKAKRKKESKASKSKKSSKRASKTKESSSSSLSLSELSSLTSSSSLEDNNAPKKRSFMAKAGVTRRD